MMPKMIGIGHMIWQMDQRTYCLQGYMLIYTEKKVMRGMQNIGIEERAKKNLIWIWKRNGKCWFLGS